MILTGASHTGKTSVAESVLRRCAPPAAFLSVDDVLFNSLIRPPGEAWSQIPLAYRLIHSQAEILLADNWLVLVESTFTYVPAVGAPQFHADAMADLIAVAKRLGAPCLLVQLSAGGEALSRSDRTGRLSQEVVRRTVELHNAAAMPPSTLRIDTANESPDELAGKVVAAFQAAAES